MVYMVPHDGVYGPSPPSCGCTGQSPSVAGWGQTAWLFASSLQRVAVRVVLRRMLQRVAVRVVLRRMHVVVLSSPQASADTSSSNRLAFVWPDCVSF